MRRHIDPHVHFRDWEESHKCTIGEGMRLARSQEVVAVGDMPNTNPPVTTEALVARRLLTAKEQGCIDGYYLYIGATGSREQLKEAARVVKSNPKVLGIKVYAGKSVGSLAITDSAVLQDAIATLAGAGYDAPVVFHCEKESLARPDLWMPRIPATWNLAKPPEMEIEGVREVISLARQSGFQGHVHICHTSTPEAVLLVNDAKSNMRITCGSTPHHLAHSTDEMETIGGMKLKVNPPIRQVGAAKELMRLLKAGKIDWIETDHAPHTKEEKTYSPDRPPGFFMSGIRSLEGYSAFIAHLRREGVSEGRIDAVTYRNIKAVFRNIIE